MPELLQEDLRQIEKTLYSPKAEELKHRQLFRVNTNFASWAEEVGYDVYTRTGSAKILAHGADAKDIPYVGGNKKRYTQLVYTMATGIKYTKAERDAVAAMRANGQGAVVNLDQLRPDAARRYIMELEHKLTFVGSSEFGIKGVLDSSYYGAGLGTMEDVAQGAGGDEEWDKKTPDEIIEDLNKARRTVEAGGLFKARTLVLPDEQWNLLKKPYSADNPMTILKWIESEGEYFERILVTNAMNSTNNGLGSAAFMVIDNIPEVGELATPLDMTMLPPVYDELETSKQAVIGKTAGVLFRHPAAAYVGKMIGT